MSQILIETPRLKLQPFTSDDLDDLHRLWVDPLVRKYLWDDQVISRETAGEIIASSIGNFAEFGFGFWKMRLKGERELIGFSGLRYFSVDGSERHEVEVLYGVTPAQSGRGLATEAWKSVLQYGFERIGLEQIYAGADAPNAASFRVMEKLGMKFAQVIQLNGVEAVYYSIQRRDFIVSG